MGSALLRPGAGNGPLERGPALAGTGVVVGVAVGWAGLGVGVCGGRLLGDGLRVGCPDELEWDGG